MDTAITTQVVVVKPIQFDITVEAKDAEQMARWRLDLQLNHRFIESMTLQEWFFTPGDRGIVCDFRVVLNEDADYQQLCNLRAKLKA